MGIKRDKPSTKARREGYAKLHGLKRLLILLLLGRKSRFKWGDEPHDNWLEEEFDKIGWRDYMIRHTPALKRGGPDVQRPSKSKRRKQKQLDRQATVR